MEKSHFHERYDVVGRLGKGQFAVVYEVLEKATKIHWAAKVISKAQCPAIALEAELNILKMVKHHHAVNFKEMFNTEESCIIVMELVTGGELFDRISEQGVFTEKMAAKFFRELLHVVKHLHDQKIVHRDLKPENILLSNKTDDAVLKVIDFGISKIAATDKALMGSCGTLPYMAPEMFSRGTYGRPVDMWALGVILYILLAGLFPYDPDEKKFDCPFLTPEFDDVSESAKDILLKLMEINPDARFTVDQALHHPWVTGETASSAAMSVDNLRNMVAKKKFKRAADTIRTGLRLRGIILKRKQENADEKALSAAKEKEKPVAHPSDDQSAAKEKEKPTFTPLTTTSDDKVANFFVHNHIGKVIHELDTAEHLIKSGIEQLSTIAKSGHGVHNADLESVEKKLEAIKLDLSIQSTQLKMWQTNLGDKK